MTWNNIQKVVSNRDHLMTSSELPTNWQPETLFVLEPGVYALMARSNKPVAKQRMKFVYETILPTIRKTGKYDVSKTASSSSEVVNYDKQLADAQIESLQLKLELTNVKYNTEVLQRNYEKQMAEFKEREYRMQLTMKDMAMQNNVSMTQFAVNALLAKDNIEENKELRKTLTDVSGRVVPEMSQQPQKEEYIAGYERIVNGKRRIRMCRSQLYEIEQQDKMIQRYRDEVTRPDNGAKRPRLTVTKRYAWLKDSAEKFLQLKCPNPVQFWLKVRSYQPHMFYGLRYTNKLKTEMETLDENELREKYKADVLMCERNKIANSKLIEDFKSLQLVDEDDCVAKCLTPSVEAKERINATVTKIVEDMNKELVPSTAPRTHSNAGETYTAEQVVHTMNNCQNYYVKNVFNIKYYTVDSVPDDALNIARKAIEDTSPESDLGLGNKVVGICNNIV
ncbi:BRO-A [Clanis bilineata nucleopolyhedrovirus]|uniref:BRO-A n=1 Tax=Clanis bilineata nucleopolyhedrovirus TaxID=1307957 RepID=Q0N452_9ABAC|nr:BRO-A [Clanis bilineata nucleopolyhedrovirus]ABF47391.1 BRO-A [Clanis bilineata nucleopolyhedrovirus]